MTEGIMVTKRALRQVENDGGYELADPTLGLSGVARNLLVASRQILAEEGLDAVSLSRIAESSGENKAMVSYYFGDKAGLLEALFEAVAFDHHAAFQRAVTVICASDHSLTQGDELFSDEIREPFLLCAQLLPLALREAPLGQRLGLLHEANLRFLVKRAREGRGQERCEDLEIYGWAALCCSAIECLLVRTEVVSDLERRALLRTLFRLLQLAGIVQTPARDGRPTPKQSAVQREEAPTAVDAIPRDDRQPTTA